MKRIKRYSNKYNCGLDFINDLRTTTYKWKAPSELPTDFDAYDADKTEAEHSE